MSRLECFGKSSAVSQKQPTPENGDAYPGDDKVGEKKVNKKVCSLPAHTQPCSEQVFCQETEQSGEGLNSEAQSPKEFTSITPRTFEKTQSRALPDEELKMRELKNLQPPDSTVKGATPHAIEPVLEHAATKSDKEQTEEEDDEDEDLKAPVELMMKLVKALREDDFELARKLCEMILIYEPEHPGASELLPLIRIKLLEEQESEESDEEDDEDEDDENSESDEKSSPTSSCSSSSSDDGEDKGDEKQVNRHKPCPPSDISP